jgi:hypothetical protein
MTTGHARQGTLALVAGLSAVLVPQNAYAASSDDAAGPVDVGLLGLGATNALGMVVGGALDALRGPSAGQTRRAMTTRTDPGTVSERPRCPSPRPAPVRARPSGAHRRGRHLHPVGST